MSGKTAAIARTLEREDADLVFAVRQGDDRAFEELYARYHTRIAAYVRGMVKDHARAEDVTQEVFFSALRRMRETERPIAFKAWVYEIARNACIDQFRRSSRTEEVSYDAEDGGLGASDYGRLVSADAQPDAAIESKQKLDHLCGAFGGLSETHHQILVLRELEGLSYREIGEQLGMSRPAVESTLFRARRRLTEEYDELVSGRRCQRVQAIIAAAAEGMLGARDKRRLERHLATCQACRRQARVVGIDGVEPRPSVARRIAAFIPVPFFLRRGRGNDGGAGGHLAQMSSTLGAAAEPLAATWAKATAALAALAMVSVGTGAATQEDGRSVRSLSDLPLIKVLSEPGAGRTVFERPGTGASPGTLGVGSGAATQLGPSVSAAVKSATKAVSGSAAQPSRGSERRDSESGDSLGDGSSGSAVLPDVPGVKRPAAPERPSAPRTPAAPSAPEVGSGGSSHLKAPESPAAPSAPAAPKVPAVSKVDAGSALRAVTD